MDPKCSQTQSHRETCHDEQQIMYNIFEHSTSMINALRPPPYMTLNPSSFLIIL